MKRTIWLSLVHLQCHRSQEEGRDRHDRCPFRSSPSPVQCPGPVSRTCSTENLFGAPTSLARLSSLTSISPLSFPFTLCVGLTKRDTVPLADPFNGNPYSCQKLARLISEILTVCWLKAILADTARARPVCHKCVDTPDCFNLFNSCVDKTDSIFGMIQQICANVGWITHNMYKVIRVHVTGRRVSRPIPKGSCFRSVNFLQGHTRILVSTKTTGSEFVRRR